MSFNKVMVTALMTMGMVNFAHAATDQGHGKVTFTGAIIDAPCSVSPDSVDQVVNLGQISNKVLEKMGKSNPRDFDIKLENCDTATLKTVTTTFSGVGSANNPKLLGIAGSASGAGVAISHNGAVVELGKPTMPFILANGDSTIHFAAYLQGESASAAIVPGDFSAVANWTLAYQ
ncbi:TPA: fimbrial protein [Serratia marcescens]